MYLFINGTQRQYIRNSIRIVDELQERVNSASFSLDGSFAISYYQDVKIYQGAKINMLLGDSLYINKVFYNNILIQGTKIWLGLGLSTEEEVTVSSVGEFGLVTLTEAAKNVHVYGELMGVKKFAGTIIDIKDSNIKLLKNIQYNIVCADYTRVFDKQLINESYSNKTARYIVNDFCNQFINYNQEIDGFNYADNAEIQSEWTESSDGNAPTVDLSDYKEKTMAGVFDWTFSAGTASWAFSLDSVNISSFTRVSSGVPTNGKLALWYKTTNYTKITSINFIIGSDSSNKITVTFAPTNNEWNFITLSLSDGTDVGTPVWTATDYFVVNVVQTGSSSVKIDGIRILEDEHFNHFPYIEDSATFSNFNIPRIKPIETMQRLADNLSWYWYIDYDKNIRLFSKSTNTAPFSINETSNNFNKLSIDYDVSKLTNQQVVKGGNETSTSTYSQVVEGDGVIKEWLMKNKFKNLVVSLDDNTATDTTEAGTTTTNITATAHGLVTGNYIVNRTRSNAVRKITRVDDDNFTVAAVTSQTSGDTFSKFTIQDVGVEGINLDAGYDFMSNYNEKSIRNSETKDVLQEGDFLLFEYNEVVPILVQRSSIISIENLKSVLGYTDGVFDGSPIIDRTITTRAEATALADVTIQKYSNVLITATFETTFEGLESGQLINIKDTTSSTRNINQDFIIQKVKLKEVEDGENIYSVTCSSSLFGIFEFFQQLLKQGRNLEVEEDAKIEKIVDTNETISATDVVTGIVNDNLTSETIISSDNVGSTLFTPPYKWGTDVNQGRWNLCEWG